MKQVWSQYFSIVKPWIVQHKYKLSIVAILLIAYIFCLPRHLFKTPLSTVVFSANGELLGARIASDEQWRFPNVQNVPEKFETCILEFEDKRFRYHWGLDLLALSRAIYRNIQKKEVVSGASTLTMQVIRLSRENPSRTILEKFTEIILATRLEWRFSKDEILALYATHAPMGGNVVGLETAAWKYYGVTAGQLSWSQTATLAVLPNAPSLIHPGKNRILLQQKRDLLLTKLFQKGHIDSLTLKLAQLEPLPVAPQQLSDIAPHFTEYIKQTSPKAVVKSSIQPAIQLQTENILTRYVYNFKQNDIENIACMVIDNSNGKVIAYHGNTPKNVAVKNQQVDIIHAPRSSGSILKPFLYGATIQEGLLYPTMLLPDMPSNFSGYSPKNFDLQYNGAISAEAALVKSLNVPAVHLLQQYGVSKFKSFLQKTGFSTIQKSSDYYGLSLILGGAETTVADLAKVYSHLAKTLNQYPEKSVPDINDWLSYQSEKEESGKRTPNFKPASIYVTFESLSKLGRPEEDALWHNFSSAQKIAWKTGTSFGLRDAWAVGVTPKYTVVVWVGNANGKGRPGLTGSLCAAPVMFEIFSSLPKSKWFSSPDEVVRYQTVCALSGHKPNQLCKNTITRQIPRTADYTLPCPYHQSFFVDTISKERGFHNCSSAPLTEKTYFVLPPDQSNFYSRKHPDYRHLPPMMITCQEENVARPILITYPQNEAYIQLAKDYNGKISPIVLQAKHLQPSEKVYWYLNDEYIGLTVDLHQLTLDIPSGKYRLYIKDSYGNEHQVAFQLTSVNEGKE